MHQYSTFSPFYPVFNGALHAYAKIEAANAHGRAVDVVEYDDRLEPELGPASRRASTYEYRLRDRVQYHAIRSGSPENISSDYVKRFRHSPRPGWYEKAQKQRCVCVLR